MHCEIRYEPEIFKRANLGYVLRVWQKQMTLSTIVAGVLLAYAILGNPPPLLRSLIFIVIFLLPAMLIIGYCARMKQSLSIFDKLDDGKVNFNFDDEGVTTQSAVGKSTLVWSMFGEIWELPKDYLLTYNNAQFITLPKDQVTPELITFIGTHLDSKD